jgi:hydroxymethylpyrimidine/phosphomethylpyrimidine kinase
VALTVAGSDPSGGAGLQADLKTFHQFGVYGESVVSLLTVQNTRAVTAVEFVSPAFLRAQFDAVVGDLPPHAAKTGALGRAELLRAFAVCARETAFPWVVDPVMVSKHGAPLLDDDAVSALCEAVLPLAFVGADGAHSTVRETLGICNRAYILIDGKVLEEGSPAAIAQSERARRYYLGDGFALA